MTDYKRSSKTSITRAERFAVIGLVHVTRVAERDQRRRVDQLTALVGEINREGKPETLGVFADAAYDLTDRGPVDADVDELLERIGLAVVDDPPAAPSLENVAELEAVVVAIEKTADLPFSTVPDRHWILGVLRGLDLAGYRVTRKES